MKIPSTLPITAEQSRASRFQLGLTQAQVIEASSLPGYKLKQFETGRFVPDMPFLENLRDFFQERGLTLNESPVATPEKPAAPEQKPGAAIWRPTQRMVLYVREDLPEAELMRMFERMDENDSRIESILNDSLEAGFVADYSAETEAKSRELFGAMAENYLIFRKLQGRNIVGNPPASPPITHGDLLAGFFAQSPLASVAAADFGMQAIDATDTVSGENEDGKGGAE